MDLDPDEVVDAWGRTRAERRRHWHWKVVRRLMVGASANWPGSPLSPGWRGWPFWPVRSGTGGGAEAGQAEEG